MLAQFLRSLVLVSALMGTEIEAFPTDYTANAVAAFTTLQTWYNSSTGLWSTTGWWNSANCLTVVGDLAALDSAVKSKAKIVMANTVVQAQKFNPGLTKTVTPEFNVNSSSASQVNEQGFLNGYYDDEGWWALGWIQAYDVTGNTEYLNTAIDIFTDMEKGSTTPCGGIWWSKANTYVNAIANELYLSVASHLANRATTTNQASYYLSIAKSQWSWFLASGMINPLFLINDGLNETCHNNNGTIWSYNQGVVLGALVELSRATSDISYLDIARSIASAAISHLSDSNGILHDPCEPSCGGDGSQFKGIFMRNLQTLQKATGGIEHTYLDFITKNALSIWSHDRDSSGTLGVNWAGPFVTPATASTHSSALDALVAAAAFEKHARNAVLPEIS